MQKIKQLPWEVITKIAAGEVVERPSSVVKELVENALDAGAKNIKIEVEKAGGQKIAVIDDGFGMEKEDLLECFKPHTTSKITSAEDIYKILSLGFRGEALSSLASVSHLRIKSRPPKSPLGHQITLIQGTLKENIPIGMPYGTEVIVENLFANTPARKKFLKKDATEFAHILSAVTRLALTFPHTGFTLIHNRKIIFQLTREQSLEERIKILLGRDFAQYLIPLQFQDEHLQIQGYICHPSAANYSNSKQYLFVNNRYIKNSLVANTIKEAYHTLLEARAYPAFLLNITVPAETIDVNIHPRKEEIKFLSPSSLSKQIELAIKQALASHDLTFNLSDEPYLAHDFSNDLFLAQTLKDNTSLWNVKELSAEQEILQVHNMYLIAQTPKGILIVDQHAAHEKILFEQFVETLEKEKSTQSQALENPMVFELSFSDAVYLTDHLEVFEKLGFEIEPFGERSFKVSQAPLIFKQRNLPDLIMEVLDDLKQDKTLKSLDGYSQKTISYLACRSAIKAGEYLTPDERRKLLNKLLQTKTIYTCPHGRPVKIEISAQKLHQLFKRI